MAYQRLWILILLMLFLVVIALPDVLNKDKPQHGEWDFKLQKVWEIDRAGDDVLGRPQGIAVSDDGTLYLSDDANRMDYLFSPEGQLIRTFAKRGEGPGEVQRHGRFFLAEKKVIIPDMGRIHYFTEEGEYLTTVNKDCEPRAFLDEHRLIDAPLSPVFLPGGKGRISLCDVRTREDKLISEFSAFEGGIARDGETVVDVVVPLFTPLMTIGYAEDRLYWGMSDRYMIRVTDLDGRDITSFSVDRKKKKVSAKDKREYFKSDSMPAELLQQIVDGLPDEVTCFHRIEVHGKIVFVYIPEIDLVNKALRTRQIDLFSTEGRYLYKAHLNFGKDRIPLFSPLQNIVIKNGFLYAVLQDEEDRVLAAKYKISLPTL